MPEFILNRPHWVPSPRTRAERAALAECADLDFVCAYVEALFFTNGDSGDEDEDSLNALGAERLTRESKFAIIRDCADFLNRTVPHPEGGTWSVRDLVEAEPGGMGQAGRDFWFTRQGHGVGFWDRDGDVWSETARDTLTSVSKTFQERTAYRTCTGWVVYG